MSVPHAPGPSATSSTRPEHRRRQPWRARADRIGGWLLCAALFVAAVFVLLLGAYELGWLIAGN